MIFQVFLMNTESLCYWTLETDDFEFEMFSYEYCNSYASYLWTNIDSATKLNLLVICITTERNIARFRKQLKSLVETVGIRKVTTFGPRPHYTSCSRYLGVVIPTCIPVPPY